jgi:hypothetical protein
VVAAVVDTVLLLPRELLSFVQVADSQLQCRLSRVVTVPCTAGTAIQRAKAAEAEAAAVNRLRIRRCTLAGFQGVPALSYRSRSRKNKASAAVSPDRFGLFAALLRFPALVITGLCACWVNHLRVRCRQVGHSSVLLHVSCPQVDMHIIPSLDARTGSQWTWNPAAGKLAVAALLEMPHTLVCLFPTRLSRSACQEQHDGLRRIPNARRRAA